MIDSVIIVVQFDIDKPIANAEWTVPAAMLRNKQGPVIVGREHVPYTRQSLFKAFLTSTAYRLCFRDDCHSLLLIQMSEPDGPSGHSNIANRWQGSIRHFDLISSTTAKHDRPYNIMPAVC